MKKKSDIEMIVVPIALAERQIYLIRGQKVMLDADLAALYGVETTVFNRVIRRNVMRFPAEFMFQLSREELNSWRSQLVTSNSSARMDLRRQPYAFTEKGVTILSAILDSEGAVLRPEPPTRRIEFGARAGDSATRS